MSMEKILWVAAIIVAAAGSVQAGLNEWTNAGLSGGDANFVIYNPAVLYAYANFMTRSEDGGDTFELAPDGFCGPGINDISPPGDLMYQDCEFGPGGEMLVDSIGTNLVSVWGTYLHRSFDHDATWQELGGVPEGRVQDIRVDPFNHGRIMVGLRGYGVAEYTDTSFLFNDGFETGDTTTWSTATP